MTRKLVKRMSAWPSYRWVVVHSENYWNSSPQERRFITKTSAILWMAELAERNLSSELYKETDDND